MEEIVERIRAFRDARGWVNPEARDLAISLMIECGELLENYQWTGQVPDPQNVADEIADVLIYAIALANTYNLDPEKLIREKLDKNAVKYPCKKEVKK